MRSRLQTQTNYMCNFIFQINSAVSLDRSRQQWINLGVHPEVCITQPDTCGAAGAAVSLWVKIFECFPQGGILTINLNIEGTGLTMFCYGNDQIE